MIDGRIDVNDRIKLVKTRNTPCWLAFFTNRHECFEAFYFKYTKRVYKNRDFVTYGKRYYSLPQRTTLTVKFHRGTREELLSCRGSWENGQFGEFEHVAPPGKQEGRSVSLISGFP